MGVSKTLGVYSKSYGIVNVFKSEVVTEKFKKYKEYIEDCPIYSIASILDPRIKGTILESEYSDGATRLATVRSRIHELYPAEKIATPDGTPRPQSQQSSIKSRFLQKVHKTTAPVSDIDRYFDSPVVEWDGKDDPNWLLNWWKNNEDMYPLMSQVARDFLAVQPAEVDVERLFSKGRDLIGLRRHSMAAPTMKAVLVTRDAYLRNPT
jgi:hypothetical protein